VAGVDLLNEAYATKEASDEDPKSATWGCNTRFCLPKKTYM